MPMRAFNNEDNIVITRATFTQSSVEKLPSLLALISPQQRQQFLKKLFGGDAAAFDKLVHQLETAPNWSVAHRVLEHYFYRRHISPYKNEATRFSDIVYRRYFPQG